MNIDYDGMLNRDIEGQVISTVHLSACDIFIVIGCISVAKMLLILLCVEIFCV